MTRTLIAIALGACIAHSAKAAPAIDDQQLHRLAGGGIAAAAAVWTQSPMTGFAWGCGANVAKELLDAAGMGVADHRDLIAGCVGAAVGAQGGRLSITRTPGGTQVQIRIRF
ncbi:MAG: hypothetical protein KIH64_015025 [Mycobacterium sp.]|nr:hypothetical protein [Mycobacterium sp.]